MSASNDSRKLQMIAIHEGRIIPESAQFLDIYVVKKPLKWMCSATIILNFTLWQGAHMTTGKSNFELAIRFPLTPSKWLVALVYFSHLGALACIYFSNISVFLLQAMYLIVLLSLAYWHYKIIYLPKRYPTELLLNDKNEWYVINDIRGETEGEMSPVELLPESFVHTHLIVLMFRQGRCKRSVILTPDNIPRTTCRRLRVRLRFTLCEPEN